MTHQWDPKQYEKFEKERNQPFFDLLHLIHPMHHPRIVDLGCGNGSLTKILHEKFHASYILGIDTSRDMLAKAQLMEVPNLIFKEQDIRTLTSAGSFNLVISNAALQWIPDHPTLFKQITHLLASAGQLAVQMPANQDYPTHTIAAELATEEPFKQAFKHQRAPLQELLSMEEYALLFDQLGFESQVVRVQLYVHFLESTAGVLEWVKGSLLTYYKSYLEPDLYAQFLSEYQKRLIDRLGWSEPFFYPMKRLFLWGQLPAY
jgi:trans-aconitate 2-methyltransferase